MTKAEKKLRKAMRQLNKAFAEVCAEQGHEYSGRFSACRIPHNDRGTYYDIFSMGPAPTDYSFYQKEE